MLVERDGVIDELTRLAGRAAAGSGQLVLVSGEAGIGKTSVVDALTDRVDRYMKVVRGQCDPLSTPVALGPATELVEHLDTQRCAPSDVTGAMRAMAPMVWVIEDAQWADGATLDALRYLTRRLSRVAALVVVTYRDDEVGPSHPLTALLSDLAWCADVYRIALQPLSPLGVQALAVLHPGVDVTALHTVTGGNPFLVSEALATGYASAAVREWVMGRLARLSPAARTVADVVSILGPDATPEMVEAVSGDSAAGIAECLRSGVLCESLRGLEFRQELARRATRDAMSAPRRRDLHAAALGAVALGPANPNTLAHLAFHAEEAADDDAVLLYAPAAAQRASDLGAHLQAFQQYGRALRHADGAPVADRALLWEAHGRAANLCGLGRRAARSITEAATLRHEQGDELREGDDLRFLSHLMYPIASVAAVREVASRAVGLLEVLPPSRELAWAYANCVQLASLTYDHARLAEYWPKLLDLAPRVGDDGPVVWARVFRALSEVTSGGAGWTEFDRVWRCAVTDPGKAEWAGLAGVVAGWAAAQRHDLDAAERYLRETLRLCWDANLRGIGYIARGTLALTLRDRGRCQEAESFAADILRRPELSPLHYLMAQVTVATVRARAGRGGVWELLDEALNSHDADDLFRTGIVWAARIEAAWLADDDARAQDEARRALATLSASVDGWTVGRICSWACIAGMVPQPPRPARGPHALQLTGAWDAAAAEWDRLGCPYQAAIARMCSDTPGAAEGAVTTFEDLGAHAAAARARRRVQDGHGSTGTCR